MAETRRTKKGGYILLGIITVWRRRFQKNVKNNRSVPTATSRRRYYCAAFYFIGVICKNKSLETTVLNHNFISIFSNLIFNLQHLTDVSSTHLAVSRKKLYTSGHDGSTLRTQIRLNQNRNFCSYRELFLQKLYRDQYSTKAKYYCFHFYVTYDDTVKPFSRFAVKQHPPSTASVFYFLYNFLDHCHM